MNGLVNARTGNRLAVPKPQASRLVWAAAAVVMGFLGWASWAHLDQITRGSGQLIASSYTQVLQAVDGGTLHTLDVKEGDSVANGQRIGRQRFGHFRVRTFQRHTLFHSRRGGR